MRIIRREIPCKNFKQQFRIYPLGDIHIGAAACDEAALRAAVRQIEEDPDAFWIGMGDYCDFINRNDPRFSPATLASWVKIRDLNDLSQAQRDRFCDIVAPIAHKCLAMVEGNHETAITRFTERHIFGSICHGIKEAAGWPEDYPLSLGYYGWLQLAFRSRTKKGKRGPGKIINMNLHHGFTGGRLAGAKALNMQRWMWSHDADITLMGHSHNTSIQLEAREGVDSRGNLIYKRMVGAFTGTFLHSLNVDGPSTYSEVKGYLPMPTSRIVIHVKPYAWRSGELHDCFSIQALM